MGFNFLKYNRISEFWLLTFFLVLTIIFSAVAYIRWFTLSFFVGSLFFVHWLGLIATALIAIFVPTYYFIKRKKPNKIKKYLKLHIYGNLFSFLLISIHFAQNIGRLSNYYSLFEDGFVLFLVLSIILATGIFERFGTKQKIIRYTKPIHRYTVVVFYLTVVFHILQGFNII